MPRVSIICTAFNTEPYLRESIDSILSQSYIDYELILIDDGSTDNTRNIMLEYKKLHKNIKLLINTENKGLFTGRNRGLLHATGEYIAIHDSDDISLPNRISTQVKFMDEHPGVAVVGSFAEKIDVSGNLIGTMRYPAFNRQHAIMMITRFKLNPIIDPSCIYRKQVIVDIGGYNMSDEMRFIADLELWCRLLCAGYEIANIPEPLIKYRINPNGVTQTFKNEMISATNQLCVKLKERTFDNPSLSHDSFAQECFEEAM